LIVESEVWKDFGLGGVILPLRSKWCLWAGPMLISNRTSTFMVILEQMKFPKGDFPAS
jgi:hypothetical protein